VSISSAVCGIQITPSQVQTARGARNRAPRAAIADGVTAGQMPQ